MNKSRFTAGALALAAAMLIPLEGMELRTYQDPVGIPTVCVGETRKSIVLRQRFTEKECLDILDASLLERSKALSECVTVPIKEHEAAALLSWAYNVGTPAACGSTLMRKLNAGQEWCSELKRWVYADGKVLKGLVNRRTAEFQMCTNQSWSAR